MTAPSGLNHFIDYTSLLSNQISLFAQHIGQDDVPEKKLDPDAPPSNNWEHLIWIYPAGSLVNILNIFLAPMMALVNFVAAAVFALIGICSDFCIEEAKLYCAQGVFWITDNLITSSSRIALPWKEQTDYVKGPLLKLLKKEDSSSSSSKKPPDSESSSSSQSEASSSSSSNADLPIDYALFLKNESPHLPPKVQLFRQEVEQMLNERVAVDEILRRLADLVMKHYVPYSTWDRQYPIDISTNTLAMNDSFLTIFSQLTDDIQRQLFPNPFDPATVFTRDQLALIMSPREPEHSYKDEAILDVIAMPGASRPDGKKPLLQSGQRACTGATGAMIASDILGTDILPRPCNIGHDDDVIRDLEHHGLEAIESRVTSLEELQSKIVEHGCSAHVCVNSCGGHVIVVDWVEGDRVEIRDPFHGWAVAITRGAFLQSWQPVNPIIQARRPSIPSSSSQPTAASSTASSPNRSLDPAKFLTPISQESFINLAPNVQQFRKNAEQMLREGVAANRILRSLADLVISHYVPHSQWNRHYPIDSATNTLAINESFLAIFSQLNDSIRQLLLANPFASVVMFTPEQLALIMSPRAPEHSYKDEAILRVIAMPGESRYDGKKPLLQSGQRGCTGATGAMIASDILGMDIAPRPCNIGHDDDVIRDLERHGLEAIESRVTSLEELQSKIVEHGCSAHVCVDSCGGHVIVVDWVGDDHVEIRDPFHGWAVALTKEAFLRSWQPANPIIQARRPQH